MRKLFTKDFKKIMVDYGKNYYNINKQKDINNPEYEKCREDGYKHLKCNTCDFRRACSDGEQFWEDNPNIIEDLIKEIVKCIEKREIKIKNPKQDTNYTNQESDV